jgi:hypothetical protein
VRRFLIAVTLAGGSMIMIALAQSVTVARSGDQLIVRAPDFDFIKGEPLGRLRDGRSVRVDLELEVLPGPGGPTAAQGRQTFVLSYDLWEQRFAVALAGPPPRSIAYLTSAAAEDWCLEQLTVPVSTLGRLARDPFWIRLGYRVADADSPPEDNGGGEFTLRALVEAFSRRRRSDPPAQAIEAGPFRLQ